MVKAVPGVKLRVVVLVPLTHVFEFAFRVATVQEVVLNSWSRGLRAILVPILLKEIVGNVD